MFEVLDLSSRVIPQLKDICKQFDIDTKGLTKSDMILKIIDAQASNKELAAKVVAQFTKKAAIKSETPTADVIKVKKPRIQKPIEGEVKVEKTNQKLPTGCVSWGSYAYLVMNEEHSQIYSLSQIIDTKNENRKGRILTSYTLHNISNNQFILKSNKSEVSFDE